MKRGQRPMPTALKLLRGNPGKQRLPANEPQPEQGIEVPDPPPFITGYAADEWWTVATQLHRLGLLTRDYSFWLASGFRCGVLAHGNTMAVRKSVFGEIVVDIIYDTLETYGAPNPQFALENIQGEIAAEIGRRIAEPAGTRWPRSMARPSRKRWAGS